MHPLTALIALVVAGLLIGALAAGSPSAFLFDLIASLFSHGSSFPRR